MSYPLCRLAGAAVVVLPALSAPAAIVTQYAAPGGSFTPTTVAPRVTASDLDETGSAGDLQPGVALPDTVFLQQNVVSPDPASAVSNGQYFQFTVAPTLGHRLNLSSLAFDAARGGGSTPRGWVVRSSADGFASDLATATVATQNPTLSPFSVSLASPAFQSVAAPTTFRVYGFAPGSGVGMFYDNITVNGDVVQRPSIVRYEAPGSAFTPTVIGNHALASNLNENGSAADLQPGVSLAESVFLQQNVSSPDAASAVANNQFFQFSVMPDPGYEFDLDALLFDATRGGSSTPRGWVVRSSLDNFASDIATGTVDTQNPTLSSFGVDLSGPAFQDISSLVTFRIYGFAPGTGVGMFYDNIALIGATNVIVPEPGLLTAVAAGILFLRRRTRR